MALRRYASVLCLRACSVHSSQLAGTASCCQGVTTMVF